MPHITYHPRPPGQAIVTIPLEEDQSRSIADDGAAVPPSEDSQINLDGAGAHSGRINPARDCKKKHSAKKAGPRSRSKRWSDNIEKLKKFKEEHGHCNVNRSLDASLAGFVNITRKRYGEKKLREDRVKTLQDMGFSFKAHEDKWDSRYNELCDFLNKKARSGERPAVEKKNKSPLTRWIGKQREEYAKGMRNKKSTMTDDRLRRLQDSGLDLNPMNVSFSTCVPVYDAVYDAHQKKAVAKRGEASDSDDLSFYY
eukprot:CAMPEP_0181041072 /NCGR_PEP_ID=MMETSP1070-20121207/11401_1 /TAXON_ID=265543 /ORGANISM="Minutocellus polymorphus, Strain NH13" /LENGTH=254 /DNA_ID=CAMNT_0023119153 /DNA_START=236 /DNA_END=1000 /DNA_ORIENTATION=+